MSAFGERLGVDVFRSVYELAMSDTPPRLTTVGLDVQRSDFNGWTVWELAPADPSGKYVVAIHGGGSVLKASTVLEWPNFADMARNTGATVIVPIFPLVPQGTAGTVVPQMADLISYEIDQHGAENVSVYGISGGDNLAFVTVQELVRRGDIVPSHMVLLSPGLDFSFSNPDIALIDDPIVSASLLRDGQPWAGGLDYKDPLVSPLYGSLEGLPPTVVYTGTVDVVYPDVLVLQDKALATPGADIRFVVGQGQLHAWPILAILPEAKAAMRDIYEQLGLV
jgi:acetyl esterase/lipase